MAKLLKGSKKGNVLYLFFQRKLLEYSNADNLVGRKKILFCLSRYFRFNLGMMGSVIINDLVKQNLLKNVTRDIYKIINVQKSEALNKLFLNKVCSTCGLSGRKQCGIKGLPGLPGRDAECQECKHARKLLDKAYPQGRVIK